MGGDQLQDRGRALTHAIPNILTVARIAITPVMLYALARDTPAGDVIAAVIFAVAAITDFIDGYLARRADVISSFGKLMDPIADKFLVIGSLVVLVAIDRVGWWVAAVIIARELAVTLTRMWVKRGGGEVIAAAQLGKWKTVIQLWAILFLVLVNPAPLWVDLSVYAAVAITIISGIDFYVRTFGRRSPAPQGS